MNQAQRFTVKALLIVGCAFGLLATVLLAIEGHAVAMGGHSTISEIMWLVWAKQPWVVFIVSHTIAAPFWFLWGHFTAQGQEVYDRIRREGL